ncbi:hypothetical protein HMPREF9069_00175 [Atopobium sp. oral taxon 810 str. F0209]|nr:hypothetical protein HMPREF9069_00175 [Atopobium sp. oral taxon 810 str. F0209]
MATPQDSVHLLLFREEGRNYTPYLLSPSYTAGNIHILNCIADLKVQLIGAY